MRVCPRRVIDKHGLETSLGDLELEDERWDWPWVTSYQRHYNFCLAAELVYVTYKWIDWDVIQMIRISTISGIEEAFITLIRVSNKHMWWKSRKNSLKLVNVGVFYCYFYWLRKPNGHSSLRALIFLTILYLPFLFLSRPKLWNKRGMTIYRQSCRLCAPVLAQCDHFSGMHVSYF